MSVVLNGSPSRGLSSLPPTTWRDAHGDLATLLSGAEDELAAGQYENAYTALRMALSAALMQRWRSVPGKANSPINDPKLLAQKLKQGGRMDRWLAGVIENTSHRPCPVERGHCAVLSEIVRCLVEGVA